MSRRAFATRLELPEEPTWAPLEAVARVARQSSELPSFHEAEFMYMGAVSRARTGQLIHLYKHRDTRRYLNLDESGHAYEYRGGSVYRAVESLADALEHADLWIFDEHPTFFRSFPPEAWPAELDDGPEVPGKLRTDQVRRSRPAPGRA